MSEARGWVRGLLGVALVLAPFSLVAIGAVVLITSLRRGAKVRAIDGYALAQLARSEWKCIAAIAAKRLLTR